MSIGSVSDALARMSTIEQQLQQLQSGALLSSTLAASTAAEAGAAGGAASASASSFAGVLAQATGDPASGSGEDSATGVESSPAEGAVAGLGAQSDAASAVDAADVAPVTASGGATLPAGSGALLTSGQQQFAATLSADTGLSPTVVSAWLLAEESGGAAQARQSQGNNDWLNVGYTDTGTYGSTDAVWSDPVTAANATAAWLQGQDAVPGYGTASAGVQSILATVGQPPAVQIQAIQDSGWSSGGYPSLGGLYAEVAG